MNRIIIIGNGFDKAHGLKTGYNDFVNYYWGNFLEKVYNKELDEQNDWRMLQNYSDDLVKFTINKSYNGGFSYINKKTPAFKPEESNYQRVSKISNYYCDKFSFVGLQLTFNNSFFEKICNKYNLANWVDIENEYYEELKALIKIHEIVLRQQKVEKLNTDFKGVKNYLCKYLNTILNESKCIPLHSIQEAFNSTIKLDDISISNRDKYLKDVYDDYFREIDDLKIRKESNPFNVRFNENIFHLTEKKSSDIIKALKSNELKDKIPKPNKTLVLNFNYTNLTKTLYNFMNYKINNIHGQLCGKSDPVIFGYGDDLDESYQEIENLNDNAFLENMKSIQYNLTNNYHYLLDFIQSGPYQVCIMGHSCGTSDRTLLNTIFEHENNISLKVYYHQINENEDNYIDLVKNISRNFNDKVRMRDLVVNKSLCQPLVPLDEQKNNLKIEK